MDNFMQRRNVLGLGAAAGVVLAAGAALDPQKAAAQAASESVLQRRSIAASLSSAPAAPTRRGTSKTTRAI